MVVAMFQCHSLNSSHPLLLQLSSQVLPLHLCIYSVQFSGSVVSDSLQPHEPQHARPPCPSLIPGVYPNSCPLSWWCHLTISSCRPLFLLPSIFPNIRVFSNESALRITWPKYWSFSFNISPSNEHPGLISFRMDWLALLQFKGHSRVFSNSTVQKHQFCAQLFFIVRLLHPYMTTRKTKPWLDIIWDWNENWPFPVLWSLLSFPNLLAYWVQHFHSIIFQDLK